MSYSFLSMLEADSLVREVHKAKYQPTDRVVAQNTCTECVFLFGASHIS